MHKGTLADIALDRVGVQVDDSLVEFILDIDLVSHCGCGKKGRKGGD